MQRTRIVGVGHLDSAWWKSRATRLQRRWSARQRAGGGGCRCGRSSSPSYTERLDGRAAHRGQGARGDLEAPIATNLGRTAASALGAVRWKQKSGRAASWTGLICGVGGVSRVVRVRVAFTAGCKAGGWACSDVRRGRRGEGGGEAVHWSRPATGDRHGRWEVRR